MKLYFYNETGEVVETVEVRENVDASRFVVGEKPAYIPRDGFYGKLFCEDGKLNWHLIPVNPNQELTGEQMAQMFMEVL